MIHQLVPAAAVTEAATTCDVQLISVAGAPIDKLIDDNPYYRAATVPGGLCKGTTVTSQPLMLVRRLTSTDVQTMLFTVVKAVFDNFSDFLKAAQLLPA